MILMFFVNKMVKEKLLENEKNTLKVRSIEGNALAIGIMSNFLIEI